MSRLLVCPPDYFSIDYEINPWMRRANAVGALACTRIGAIPSLPTTDEVETFLATV